jgi:hypothetical protein
MSLFGNRILTGGQADLVFAQAPHGNMFTPVAPPPQRFLAIGNVYEEGTTIDLDGINFQYNVFKSPTFVYGGGAYSMRDAEISGTVNFQFIGAAANTVQLLKSLGLLGNSPPPSTPVVPQPNTPRTEKTVIKTTIKGDFVSPYDGTK